MKAFPLKSGIRQGYLLSSLLFIEIKDIQTGKKEVKLSIFEDNIILHIEVPKDPSPTYTTRSNKQIQQRCIQHVYISCVCIYQLWTIQKENSILTVLFTIASKRVKYLGTKLTREVNDSHTETIKPQWNNLKRTI